MWISNIAVLIFLALTALVGMSLGGYILLGKATPKALVLVHGFLAILSLLLLGYAVFYQGQLIVAAGILVLAASSGLIIAGKDFAGIPISRWFPIAHGLLAASGFILLILAMLE